MNKPFTKVDIIRTVRLLKAANCTEWATLAETARELGIQKTRLMEYIENHPKLFILRKPGPGWKGANPGLLIQEAFVDPDMNWTTDNWLRNQQEKWRNRIHVSVFSEYGQVQGYYIEEDHGVSKSEDHRENTHLWRNTPEKMQRIAASGHTRPGSFWGGGDGRLEIKREHTLNDDDLKALRAEGWTIDGGPNLD